MSSGLCTKQGGSTTQHEGKCGAEIAHFSWRPKMDVQCVGGMMALVSLIRARAGPPLASTPCSTDTDLNVNYVRGLRQKLRLCAGTDKQPAELRGLEGVSAESSAVSRGGLRRLRLQAPLPHFQPGFRQGSSQTRHAGTTHASSCCSSPPHSIQC